MEQRISLSPLLFLFCCTKKDQMYFLSGEILWQPRPLLRLLVSHFSHSCRLAFLMSHVRHKVTAPHAYRPMNAGSTKAKQILVLLTRSMFTVAHGTSAQVLAQRSRTNMQQCRACTLAGQVGVHLPCGHLRDGVGFERSCCCIRRSPSCASSSQQTTSGLTAWVANSHWQLVFSLAPVCTNGTIAASMQNTKHNC